MKNRQAAILTGMFLCMAAVTGCGSNTETQAAKQQGSEIEDTAAENTAAEGDDEKTDGKTGKTEEQNKENQIFGKIVSVSEDSITISVESAPVNGTEDGKENSGTEETGEEQTIALTENTVIRNRLWDSLAEKRRRCLKGKHRKMAGLRNSRKKYRKTVEHRNSRKTGGRSSGSRSRRRNRLVRSKRRRHGSYYFG